MEKYIVKNCDKHCKMCEYISNCLTKQVIEMCNIEAHTYNRVFENNQTIDRHTDGFSFAQKILDMFEIEIKKEKNKG